MAISDEFAGMGLEVAAEEKRYVAFREGRLAAMVSSIPGLFLSTERSRWSLSFASGHCILASCDEGIEHACHNAKSFPGFLEALRRSGFRLEKERPRSAMFIR